MRQRKHKMKQLVCPISKEKIDERITRSNALLGILLLVLAIVFKSSFFVVFLAADFFIRAFTKIKYSPISYLSHLLTNALGFSKKSINKAPKIFAARLGFIMASLIMVLTISGLHSAALFITGILIFFSALEFALALCVGCIIYTYLILPFYKNS